jgi:hydroxyethylthiazole kinase-like uncharacterized protein yjeF
MCWSEPTAAPSADTVAVAGCGGSDAIAATLPHLLEQAARLVLDADALNAVATSPLLLAQLAARSARQQSTVITPHPLEAARLLGRATGDVQADRLAAARELAQRWQLTVILKGSGSIVASPGHLPAINSSGGPALATAGTGDVLAGWLGGLWAQALHAKPHELACAAVYTHGLAGEGAQRMRASDLLALLAAGAGA